MKASYKWNHLQQQTLIFSQFWGQSPRSGAGGAGSFEALRENPCQASFPASVGDPWRPEAGSRNHSNFSSVITWSSLSASPSLPRSSKDFRHKACGTHSAPGGEHLN